MKVLIVDPLFTYNGGGQIISYNTYKLLKEQGIDAYFWAMDKKPYFEEDYEYQSYFTKYYGGGKDYIKNPIKYYYNKQAQKDLSRFINVIKPDLIHINGLFGITPSILKVCKPAKIVVTLHGTAIVCPAGTLARNNKNVCCNEQYCRNGKFYNCILHNCTGNIEANIRGVIRSYTYQNSIKDVDYFITPTEKFRQTVLSMTDKIELSKIKAINNFLPKSELNNKPVYTNQGYFLCVGRLVKEKGFQYILKAFADLPRDIKLHIVGSGNYEKFLKKYTKQNNLYNVTFMGQLSREELKKEYEGAIAYSSSSLYETFGLTNIEAFSHGKPVIVSNRGGLAETCEHNVNGFLVEPMNIEQLQNCFLTYWKNPQLAVDHGKNGYLMTIKKYNETKYVNELLDIYKKILGESN